jgi:hypothetical protein
MTQVKLVMRFPGDTADSVVEQMSGAYPLKLYGKARFVRSNPRTFAERLRGESNGLVHIGNVIDFQCSFHAEVPLSGGMRNHVSELTVAVKAVLFDDVSVESPWRFSLGISDEFSSGMLLSSEISGIVP